MNERYANDDEVYYSTSVMIRQIPYYDEEADERAWRGVVRYDGARWSVVVYCSAIRLSGRMKRDATSGDGSLTRCSTIRM